ncbi:hypothetical protein GO755_30435 [Spirosoma sp. HMF4905]|uniref:Uncharacterized protein n=1 Tax=Spirosoma arboris TaxID=2682092 RepID=A0A7K1SKQ6_9BACT|nr:hypothetical protein [Spirosoma arboris]MVM34389.1 hypothetical protein [Spirosoma arboris]
MADKDKRHWPLDMLKARRKLLQILNENIEESDVKDAYFSFKPVDNYLPYFFIVREFDNKGEQPFFRAVYMPKTNSDASEGTGSMTEGQLEVYFKDWMRLVNGYIEQFALDKDTILQGYEEEFLEAFVIESDDNTHSYPTATQLKIDQLCTDTIKLLHSFVNDNSLNGEKKQEVESIIESVQELQDTQTQLPKGEVRKKLANIWARIKKAGIKLFVEVKAEAFKAIIKEGVKGLLDNPMAPIDFANDLLDKT